MAARRERRKSNLQVLESSIATGFRAGDDRVTVRDVAELAGVSISAVSRVFTTGASVSETMRSKVLRATRTLGYQPNLLARSLKTRRTELIGLISDNFDNPAHMEIFDLFTRRLQQQGLRPILVNLTDGVRPNNALEVLQQYSVDGVIVASSTLHRDFAAACAEVQIPVVQAFGRPGASMRAVGADNVQGGRIAGDLLCQRGYKRIAFLGGPQSATSTGDRLKGLRARLRAEGLRPVVETYGKSFSHETGKTLMRRLLADDRTIDAVFCGDDIIALGALDVCRDAGVRVPRDIGIVGFDDIPIASWPAYDLTTIRQPIADIIVTAVDLVLSIIEGTDRPAVPKLFPCAGIVRGTLRQAARRGLDAINRRSALPPRGSPDDA